jgi:hypothetical protein
MTAGVATRAPNARARTTPPGTGHLHQALEDSRDLATLQRFCSAHVCTPAEVSADGKRLDMLRVFDLMRGRGYQVSPPARAQHQPKHGFTKWLVDITLPGPGPSVKLGFFTPNSN